MTSVRVSTDLYRYFDKDDRLLYVGISFHAAARASQHRADKPWWPDVARMDVEHLPSREEALAAELVAIRTEKPIHNIVGNGKVSSAALLKEMVQRPSRESVAKAKQGIIELVGLWNLSPPDDGEFPRVEYQTRTLADLGDRYYLIQFYSWWDGEPTNTQVLHLSDMLRWKSYDTHEKWLAAGEVGMRANDLWVDGLLSA